MSKDSTKDSKDKDSKDLEKSKAVLSDVTKKHDLTHVKSGESLSGSAAKVQLELRKKPDLDHVDAPKSDLTESQKAAFLEDQKEKKDKK